MQKTLCFFIKPKDFLVATSQLSKNENGGKK